jgi:hypothetical protein
MRKLRVIATCSALVCVVAAARADIFQWEYVDPVDLSQGKRESATLAPDGAGVDALPGAQLAGRNLANAYLIGADLSATYSCFDWCYLGQRTDLSGANLTHADLTSANLSSADLSRANLRGANLTEANLDAAILTHTDLGQAVLTNASLLYATLSGADFTGAHLKWS